MNGIAFETVDDIPFADLPEDMSYAYWLLNATRARDWQQFQSTGEIKK